MPPSPPPGAVGLPDPALSRRRLFAVAGLLVLAAGCTSTEKQPPSVTPRQADALARQVTVQEALVAAYAAAAAADPSLGSRVADVAGQAKQQLDRLKAAAPSATASASGSSASGSGAPVPGPDVVGWLRQQVVAAATSHADACLDQAGARAALLGSVAAGLRGQDARLA